MSGRKWTKQSVIDAIRSRHERGLPLSRVWTEDKPLFRAAVRTFGGWTQALLAAGLGAKTAAKMVEAAHCGRLAGLASSVERNSTKRGSRVG